MGLKRFWTPRKDYLAGLKRVHAFAVLRRREEVLASRIAELLGGANSLLDVGCGDGVIAGLVAENRPGMTVEGVEVLDREHCAIPYVLFDGTTLPFPDGAFDCVSFVDVLHHTEDPSGLIGEAARVSGRYVVIKDHVWSNRFDYFVLRVMDWVGNRPYKVHLNYNYLRKQQWDEIFERHGLHVAAWNTDIGLYPFPFNLLFEHGKHFIALLETDVARSDA